MEPGLLDIVASGSALDEAPLRRPRGVQLTRGYGVGCRTRRPGRVVRGLRDHAVRAAGGWVHVSRLGRHVLWTPLELEHEDDLRAREYTPPAYLREHGALAVPVIDWDGWRERIPTMPQAAELPTTHRRELLRAWKPPGFDPFERENSAVSAIADWLAVDAPVDADLVRADEIGAQVELLYGDVHDTFDRQHLRDWQAFALRAY